MRPVCSRAIRIACSMASAPPLVKNTLSRSPGVWLAISRAASDLAALACCGATVQRYAACSWMAETIRGCWWPMLVKTSWEVKSSSRWPSWSQTWEPSALVITIGFSDPWADQEWKTCLRSSSRTRSGVSSTSSEDLLFSDILREPQLQATLRTVGGVDPPGGDDLATGEEVDTLGAVGVGVPEQRALPASEGVVGDGHRHRHVDADHAHVDVGLEAPRGPAVVGEHGRAVAVGVGVHESHGLVVGVDAYDGQ